MPFWRKSRRSAGLAAQDGAACRRATTIFMDRLRNLAVSTGLRRLTGGLARAEKKAGRRNSADRARRKGGEAEASPMHFTSLTAAAPADRRAAERAVR